MEVILRPGGDDVVSYDAKSLGMYYYLIRNALPHKITFHHDPNLSLTQSFPVVRANGTSSDGTFVSAFQQLSGIDMCDDFILVGYVEQILETAFYQYWVMDEQNRGHTNHLYRHDYMQSWMGSYLAPLLTNTTHHHCNIPLAVGCDHFEGTLQWLAARMDERGFDENGRVESVFIGYISLLLLFPLPNPTLLTTLQRYPKIVSAVQTAMKGIGINLPDPQPTPTPSTRTANTTGVRLVAFAMVATCFLLWRARQSS